MVTSQTSELLQQLHRIVLPLGDEGPTDGELLTDYLTRRDEAALTALVRRHAPMVWGVCRRVLRNHQDAEDAFQATFLVLVRKASSVVPREMVVNWLYGVAHQTALKRRATSAKRGAREMQVTEMPERAAAGPDPLDDLQPLLDQQLSRLPDKYRVAIVLCDLEGKTRTEAARQLGVPEGTVAARVARGRVMLAKRLTRRGVVVSGGALATLLSRSAASACVPNAVVSSTVKAASLFAAGRAAGVVSAGVVALTEGVLKAMLLKKLKVATAVLAVVLAGGLVAGATLMTPKAATPNPVKGKADEPEKPIPASRTLKGEYRFLSLSFSRDGTALATVTMDADAKLDDITEKNAVRVWDVQSGSIKRTLAEDPIKERYYCTYAGVGLSPDGKTVAAPVGGKYEGEAAFNWLVLWDAETGKIRHKLKHDLEVRALGFSPDNKLVASGTGMGGAERDYDTVLLWDVKTGQLLRTLKTRDLEGVKMVFAPDSKRLAAVLDPVLDHSKGSAEVVLWDAVEGKAPRTLPDSEGIEVVAFSPDGKTLLGAARTKLLVWDVAAGKTIQKSDLRTTEARSALAFSPDGKVLAVADKHDVALYDVKTAKRTKTLEGGKGVIESLSLSPDGHTLAAGSSDQTIYLWDFDQGAKPKR